MLESEFASEERSQPGTLGQCATLACIWEATAAKPGNVHRGADFEDVAYTDFLASAVAAGPCFEQAAVRGVGATVLAAVRSTRAAVGTNTNLGTLLLLAPLAAVPMGQSLEDGVPQVLDRLTEADTRDVYEAIRLAQPGGLDEVDSADVREPPPAGLSLVEAMRLAAERDSVALQYVNHFEQVFTTAERIAAIYEAGHPMGEAIVHGYLQLLAELPDSLVARKCGRETAEEVSARAAAIVGETSLGSDEYIEAVGELDFYLRSDGHRRNPGTSADLVAAALFVLLREQRLDWPVRFYRLWD